MPKSEGLTPKQESFCREYIKDFNATQAAIRAGYAASGAQSHASKLLGSTCVSARVRELVRGVAKKAKLDAELALRRAMETLNVNIYDLVSVDKYGEMKLKENEEIASHKQRQVLELKYSKSDGESGSSTICQVRVKDNTQALKLVFQYLKLVGDDRNPDDDNSGTQSADRERVLAVIERIRKRRERKGLPEGTL